VQVQTANALMGSLGELDTFGGTGYTTGGPSGRPYLWRLQHDGELRHRFDLIVLEGGTNDAHHGSLGELAGNARKVLDYIGERQPRARIVMVGGFAHRGSPPGARYVEMDRILAGVAAERGLTYVSQLGYATRGGGFYSRDGLHPSSRGYAQMGRDLAAALSAREAVG
jgi:lysophospholipase L1-like esterase